MAWDTIKKTYRETPNKYSCLHTDEKPTNNVNEGSTLYEVQADGSIEIYKYLQGEWRKM